MGAGGGVAGVLLYMAYTGCVAGQGRFLTSLS